MANPPHHHSLAWRQPQSPMAPAYRRNKAPPPPTESRRGAKAQTLPASNLRICAPGFPFSDLVNQVGVDSQYKNTYSMQHAQQIELCGVREFSQYGHAAGYKSSQERFPQEIDLGRSFPVQNKRISGTTPRKWSGVTMGFQKNQLASM